MASLGGVTKKQRFLAQCGSTNIWPAIPAIIWPAVWPAIWPASRLSMNMSMSTVSVMVHDCRWGDKPPYEERHRLLWSTGPLCNEF